MSKKLIIIILIIWGLYDIALIFSFDKIFPDSAEIEGIGKIISLKEEKDYVDKYTIRIISINHKNKNTNQLMNHKKIIIYVPKQSSFKAGDIIHFNGNFEKGKNARNYKGFNYENYLKQSQIYGTLKCSNCEKIDEKKDIITIILNLKENLLQIIHEEYKDNSGDFLCGVLFGETEKLDDEIIDNLRDSNLLHILSISGLHISYIVFGLHIILYRMINNRRIKNSIIIGILIVFYILTGFSKSCFRACMMNILVLLSYHSYRKTTFIRNIGICLFLMILLNPYNIFSVGMWLSIGGTIGINLFYPFTNRIIKQYKKRKERIKRNIGNKILFYIYSKTINSILVSISVQILVEPIILYSFNTISLSFFVSNIVISFIIGPILVLGYFSVFYKFIEKIFLLKMSNLTYFPVLRILMYFILNGEIFIVKIENFLINILFQTAKICSKWPVSKIYFGTPNLVFILMFYFMILSIFLYFQKNKFYIIRIVLGDKKTILKCKQKYYFFIQKTRFHFSLIIVCLMIFLLVNILWLPYKDLMIHFVDVGQGDCTVIVTPNGKTIMVDGGEGKTEKYDYGKNVVLPYLLDRRITKVNYMIVSHFDSDHVGRSTNSYGRIKS